MCGNCGNCKKDKCEICLENEDEFICIDCGANICKSCKKTVSTINYCPVCHREHGSPLTDDAVIVDLTDTMYQ